MMVDLSCQIAIALDSELDTKYPVVAMSTSETSLMLLHTHMDNNEETRRVTY
jgi:uncharacterized Rossmann fold enzyme